MIHVRLICILLLLHLTSDAQPIWKLVKEKNGIKVFFSDGEHTSFKKIRVQTNLDGSFAKLTNILMDADSHHHWVYKTKQSKLLKKFSANEMIYYSETSMPWPVSNRDAVVRLTINPDTTKGTMAIRAVSEPAYLQKKQGLIRIPYSVATWQIIKKGKQLNVDYTFDVDPGGSLPAWLVNLMADKGPYESFLGLSRIMRD